MLLDESIRVEVFGRPDEIDAEGRSRTESTIPVENLDELQIVRSLEAAASGCEFKVMVESEAQLGTLGRRFFRHPTSRKLSRSLMPVLPEDLIRVSLDSQTEGLGLEDVFSGRAFDLLVSRSANEDEFHVIARDAVAELVDCSAFFSSRVGPAFFRSRGGPSNPLVLEPNPKQEFYERIGSTIEVILVELALAYGVSVVFEDGLRLSRPELFDHPLPLDQPYKIDFGDTVWAAIEKVCGRHGLLAHSDGLGRLVVGVAGGIDNTDVTIEEGTVLSYQLRESTTDRYQVYVVKGQSKSAFAELSLLEGRSLDEGIARFRKLMVVAEGAASAETCALYAQWEASIRKARSNQAVVVVPGWRQPGGPLWNINQRVGLRIDRYGIDKTVLISRVSYRYSKAEGTTAELTLVGPDAYKVAPILKEDSFLRLVEELQEQE